MICFPNAKINIGLKVLSKREDGLHNIESIFFPIDLCDILEVLPSKNRSEKIKMSYSGNISCIKNDLCVKAYTLLDIDFKLPSVNVFLHKKIPIGAGLGGGSSNAVSMLKTLNELFDLNLNNHQLLNYCKKLGSDCVFFLKNKPSFVSGFGDLVNTNINFSLQGYKLILIFPYHSLSSFEVFKNLHITKIQIKHDPDLFCKILNKKILIKDWKKNLKNDLESSSFELFPRIKKIKTELYNMGAIYASMTGSGSSVFGVFSKKKDVNFGFEKDCFVYSMSLY